MLQALFSFRERYRILHLTWFAFFLSFAVWFSVAPFATMIQRELDLTSPQLKVLAICNLALSIPARIMIGMVLDRYGPRLTFSALLVFALVPCLLTVTAHDFNQLVWSSLINSIMGAGFVVGVRMVAEWFPSKEIGLAQGVYGGWGNFGAAASQFCLPVLAVTIAYFIGGTLNWRIAIAMVGFVTALYGSIYFRYTQDTPPGKVYQRPQRHGGLEVTSPGSFWAMTLLDLGLLVSLGLLTYPLAQNNIHFLNSVQVQFIWVFLGLLYVFQFYKVWQVNREIVGSLNPFSSEFLQSSQHYPPNQRYQVRQIALLDFTYLTNFGSQITVLSILPTWFEQTFGLNPVTASLVATAYPVLNLVSRPSGGLISDRAGSRKWTMTGLTLGIGIGYLLMGKLGAHSNLTVAIGLMMLCAYFVQAGAGATFSIVPLIRKSAIGQIAGSVGAYGNVGGMIYLQIYSLSNAQTLFYSMGVTALICATLCAFFLKEPQTSFATNSPETPVIQPFKADTKDPVESDINDIPHLLQEIEDEWKNPSSFNRKSAEYLLSLLIEKAKHFEARMKIMLQAGLTGESEQLQTVDLLIIGIESSLWLGERFAQDLKTIFPLLNVLTLSSNQALKKLHDFKSLNLGKYSLVLAISQSGQTFSTLHATHGFNELCRKGAIGELFIMTGELSSLMGLAIGQSYYKGAAFRRRIFINGSGRRTAEPSTVAVAAAQQTLSELLFRIAKRMRQAFLDGSNPFGMTLTSESLLVLETIKSDFLTKSLVSITGTSTSGVALTSPENQKLISRGREWALNVTETPFAWGIHALYVLITIGWVIPFGHTIPLIKTIFNSIVFAAGLPNNLFLFVLIDRFVTLADIAIYIFGPWLWTLGIRYFQGRQLLARTGKRILVIGDVPWVHQLLKSYVSNLFSLSYGISSLEVHGANPQDDMLHNFRHRVVRGTLFFLGVPDGRRSRMQKNDESAVIMTGQQVNGVRNIGVGPEIVVVGHNPEIEHKGFNSAITLWSHTDSLFEEKKSTVDYKAVIDELRESRFSSFERLLAGYVLFWALAKKVAEFPFLKYQYWKSQSRTRIATTATPVSVLNLDWPEDEEGFSTSIGTKKYTKPKY